MASRPTVHEQTRHIHTLIEDALKKFNRPLSLLMILAKSATEQENYVEAENCYREVVKMEPFNAPAMNNLAVMLVAQNTKLDEAMTLINRAMEIAGPRASMLDTRATIYLAKKEADNALADMKIVLGDDVEPDRLFHQARAYYLAGQRDKAAEVIAAARKAGLKPSVLEPYERPIYERLRENLR